MAALTFVQPHASEQARPINTAVPGRSAQPHVSGTDGWGSALSLLLVIRSSSATCWRQLEWKPPNRRASPSAAPATSSSASYLSLVAQPLIRGAFAAGAFPNVFQARGARGLDS